MCNTLRLLRIACNGRKGFSNIIAEEVKIEFIRGDINEKKGIRENTFKCED